MTSKLEPELESILPPWLRDDPTPVLVGIDSALKTFKAQIESGRGLPSNSDLRQFLDHQGSNYVPTSYWDLDNDSWRRVKDVTLLCVISLSDKLDSARLRSIICETPSQELPLVEKAIEYSLWRSVALMLACGATLGAGNTLKKIVASRAPGSISREEQDFLDLTTLITSTEEPYFLINFGEKNSSSKPLPQSFQSSSAGICGSIRDLLQIRAPWLERTSQSKALSNWFHVPSTNGLIIMAILAAITGEMESPQIPMEQLFYDHFVSVNVASGDQYLTYRNVRYWSRKEAGKTVVVFPTLMMTTLGQHCDNREKFEIIRDNLSTQLSGRSSSLCTVHFERTLDETYFPGLTAVDFSERNKDQVVSNDYSENPARRPIIIVPQLWLWQVNGILISAHSMPRESEGFALSKHITANGEREVWGPAPECQFRCPFRFPKWHMARLIADNVRAFGKEGLKLSEKTEDKTIDKDGLGKNHHEPEKETKNETEVPPILDLFERQVVNILWEVKKYTRNTPRKRIVYAEEERFHHKLSDCRSELAMIQHVLDQQVSIITSFSADLTQEVERVYSGKGSEREAWEFKAALDSLNDALADLKEYKERILKIDGDAERVEKSVQDLLNLKRTFASVQDSHASVLLGLAAFAFAIVTIIFAPLAFLTAFFALDVQGFDKLQISTNEPRETTIGTPEAQIDKAKDNPVYHGGIMAGILVGSVFTTVLVTGVLVFLLMRYTGIELNDLRFEKQPELEAKGKKKKNNKQVTAKNDETKITTGSSSLRSSVTANTSNTRKTTSTGAEIPMAGVEKDGATPGAAEVRRRVGDLEAQ